MYSMNDLSLFYAVQKRQMVTALQALIRYDKCTDRGQLLIRHGVSYDVDVRMISAYFAMDFKEYQTILDMISLHEMICC